MTSPPAESSPVIEDPGQLAEPANRKLRLRSPVGGAEFSTATRWFIIIAATILGVWFVHRMGSIIWPFIWAIFAAYVVLPLVDFLNDQLRIPRIVIVLGLLIILASAIIVGSRSLFPWLRDQLTYFAQDLPKLNGALISKVGSHPLGINITKVFDQLAKRLSGSTTNASASIKLLTTAVTTVVRILIFLFTTIYLLVDAPRLRRNLPRLIPGRYRAEASEVAARINGTWMSYIRGEFILFVIMTVASYIGLSILQVQGALPLAVATGVLELVPLLGPYTAGGLAVGVAYLSGHNPFGWSQVTYGIVVALMYLAFRETEDYIVIPRVLGHAVKLHPLVILFSLTAGSVIAGIFGLLVAVPVAASIKIVAAYLYDKVVIQRPEFARVHGVNTGPDG